jgi:DDE superfamily endonuclease
VSRQTTTGKASTDPNFTAYTRYHGVMQMIAALDLATGKRYYRIRRRQRWREHLSFRKTLRTRRPGQKLYVIADNYSPHQHPQVRTWAAANDVELVFRPTYGSWLTWIASESPALRYYAPQRHRPPHPRRAERGNRRLRPLAQRPSPAQDQLRRRLTHPKLDQLPGQGCVTGH